MTVKLRPGRRGSHGGYSFLTRGELPESRAYIELYLTQVREGLIRDIGSVEENLTTAQLILIDRTVSILGVLRCIEEHVKDNGVMQGETLSTSLRQAYLAYNNSVRLNLVVLGVEKRADAGSRTALEIIKEFDDEKAAREEGKV